MVAGKLKVDGPKSAYPTVAFVIVEADPKLESNNPAAVNRAIKPCWGSVAFPAS